MTEDNAKNPKYRLNKPPQIDKEAEKQKLQLQQQQFSAIRNMKVISKMLSSHNSMLSKFNPEQVATFLRNPARYEKQLRQLSNYLYNVNAQYKMVIKHMATSPVYAYDLDLIGSIDSYAPDKLKKSYLKTSQYVDKLNLQHEMSKALKIAFKEDVFYGYEHESKDSYFIQKLDADYCKTNEIEDGVLNYAFDFSYFDNRKDELTNYPEEFQIKYQIYLSDKNTMRWIGLNSDKICYLKINEELDYVLPPFSTMIESIFDRDEYKKIKKAKAKMDNFLLLVQKIPLNKDGRDLDSFLIDPVLANQFHENTGSNLPDEVGLTTTPMDIEAISLEKKQNTNDPVNEALGEIFSDAGISQYLFSSDKSSSVGIAKSIIANEQIIFDVMEQIQRWLNRKIKKMPGAIKYHVSFLNYTRYSQEEEFNRSLKAGQNGVPDVMRIGAALGMSPNQLYNKAIMENQILDLHSIIRPLASSHTQSGDNSTGAPSVSDNDAAESTIINRDAETDIRKKEG